MRYEDDQTTHGLQMNNHQQWNYLRAHFLRIDILIRREVQRWLKAGQDPNDDYRGMYVTQTEVESLLERPFGTSWGQSINLPADEEDNFEAQQKDAKKQIKTLSKQFQKQGRRPRLQAVVEDFGLDQTDLDILLLCIAPAFDTSYDRIYSYLQDNVTKRRPSIRLMLDILGNPSVEQFDLADHLIASAPLFRHGLLTHVIEPAPANEHWINQTLCADETIISWLRGHYEHHGLLRGHISLNQVTVGQIEHLLVGDALPALSAETDPKDDPAKKHRLFALYGIDQARQDAAARLIAHEQTDSRLLLIDLQQIVGEKVTAQDAVAAALRDARLTNSALYLKGWDVCLDVDKYAASAVFRLICEQPITVIISSATIWRPHEVERTSPLVWCEFDKPNYTQRRTIWEHCLTIGESPKKSRKLTQDLDNLASQFELTSGSIRDAVAAAYDSALQQRKPLSADELFASARRYSNPRLSALALKIEPRYEWDDIVLLDDHREILRELVSTVRQRNKVLDEWGVGRKLAASAGVTVLFSGPPGTGKTMAAEVIAGELRLDLYKIDLSSVVSKYIGETEKNLEKIFTEAGSSNAILFFDEADAIFGKRSEVKDAHDRHANVEVAYLLQRMEAYDGVTILATNLRGNLDDAFTRRLSFAVDFPFPRVADRLRIWQTLFPPDVPRSEDLDLNFFAKEFELAGGNIRNIIVSAAYLAADNGQMVTRDHLLHATKRELRKMGRLVGGEDFMSTLGTTE